MKAVLLALAIFASLPAMAGDIESYHRGHGRRGVCGGDRYDLRDRYDVYYHVFRSRRGAECYCPAGDDVMAYYGYYGRGYVCVKRTLN